MRPTASSPVDAVEATDMVDVEVAEDHERVRHRTSSPRKQPVHRFRVGPGVDHHGPAGVDREHQRVALPDRAGHHHPAGAAASRRPAAEPAGRPARQRPRPPPPAGGPVGRRAATSSATVSAGRAAARPAPRPARAGCRPAAGHPCRAIDHQPPAPASSPARRRTRHRPASIGDITAATHAQHRRRGDGRHRQQVGRHRHQAHRAGDARRRPGRRRAGRPPARPAPRPARRARLAAAARPASVGASSSRPPVASTDSANPGPRPAPGRRSTSTVTARGQRRQAPPEDDRRPARPARSLPSWPPVRRSATGGPG